MIEWQPIETAPRDETLILVGSFTSKNNWAGSDMWDKSQSRWLNHWRCIKELTHWAPLNPPAQQ